MRPGSSFCVLVALPHRAGHHEQCMAFRLTLRLWRGSRPSLAPSDAGQENQTKTAADAEAAAAALDDLSRYLSHRLAPVKMTLATHCPGEVGHLPRTLRNMGVLHQDTVVTCVHAYQKTSLLGVHYQAIITWPTGAGASRSVRRPWATPRRTWRRGTRGWLRPRAPHGASCWRSALTASRCALCSMHSSLLQPPIDLFTHVHPCQNWQHAGMKHPCREHAPHSR